MSVLSIIIAILILSLLIFVHELGHFIFAKKCGIGVEEFSLGMGPRIISKKIGNTRYSWKAIPIGGSCAMVGEDEEDSRPDSFNSRPVRSRILVIVAGPLFNFLFAFVVSIFVIAFAGTNPPIVYNVTQGSGAQEAGIEEGDRIISIGGTRIFIGRDIPMYIYSNPPEGTVDVVYERDGIRHEVSVETDYKTWMIGISYMSDGQTATISSVTEGGAAQEAGVEAKDMILAVNGVEISSGEALSDYFSNYELDSTPIVLTISRDGSIFEVEVTPQFYEGSSLGFDASYYRQKDGFAGTFIGAVQEVGYWIKYCLWSLFMLITGQVGIDQMSGPIGIVSLVGQAVGSTSAYGTGTALLNVANLTILLSANLGVFNLLPLPALDGGRLVFLIIEGIRRRPISRSKEGLVHAVGFMALMGFMVFIMYNDIVRLFTGG